ncbi:Endo-1,4-beta-xylanase 5 [Hypocenomyce scalaris]|nr:Endo-1,4-beta-xylanase 5 [Hypocenomyce scalaris]
MENFITGYPGHESQHRKAMQKVLGKEKADFFFDKLLEYYFTAPDAAFFVSSLGLNCLRLPFNFRHFEDDMNPRVLKVEGFRHLDRVVDLHGIYTILDMHTSSAAKTWTGTPIIQLIMRRFGTTKTITTAPYGCGRGSPSGIEEILGSLATNPSSASTNLVTRSITAYPRSTLG